MKINAETIICATLAKPNKTTKAPQMYNAAFDELELNYAYIALEPESIEAALQAVRSLRLGGVSVSTPYKEEAVKYVDEVDETASEIGATNAIVNKDGHLVAYNTDWMGAIKAIEEHVDLQGVKIALLGAGGAAKAIAYGLKKRGAVVTLYNRNIERGQKLADQFDLTFGGNLNEVASDKPPVIINATSASKNGEDVDVPETAFTGCQLVMDIASMETTKFLERVKNAGVPTINGQRMLVLQGAETFKLFTGKQAPIETMLAAIS